MPKTLESSLALPDGVRLQVIDFWPQTSVRQSVLMMHGLGEHSGRRLHLAQFFVERGFAVRCYDHRGHGRSEGARGDVPNPSALLDDARVVMNDWQQQLGAHAPPPFLFGHSLGGLVAARFATAGGSALSGLILSSPALALPLNFAQKLLLKTLTVLAPSLAVANGLKQNYLSHDPQVIQAYRSDPLVHSSISARFLNAMLADIQAVQHGANQLTMPVLLLVSGDDKLVDVRGSHTFFEHLNPALRQLVEYPDLYHEIFNETESAKVFADLDRWLAPKLHQHAA
jgi:alpha-beta hydrolase superfamily lysophospholipase